MLSITHCHAAGVGLDTKGANSPISTCPQQAHLSRDPASSPGRAFLQAQTHCLRVSFLCPTFLFTVCFHSVFVRSISISESAVYQGVWTLSSQRKGSVSPVGPLAQGSQKGSAKATHLRERRTKTRAPPSPPVLQWVGLSLP